MKKLILIRGLSGSGKSTLAGHIIENSDLDFIASTSTDDFFMVDGEYKFDPSLLSLAHTWNQANVVVFMRHSFNIIIVPNTFSQWWEAEPYVKYAKKYGYEVEVLEPATSWAKDAEECFKRNTHGVPLETIKKMIDRWESTAYFLEKINEMA